jgi:GNAT superfamily N-acetyltransferase
VAGVGGWTVAAPGRGRIVLLYVAPDHAGAGVGAALLARMEAEMVAAGCGEAELEATVTARGFYRAHGWRDAPRCGEGPCLPMTRTLAAAFPGTA